MGSPLPWDVLFEGAGLRVTGVLLLKDFARVVFRILPQGKLTVGIPSYVLT